MFTTTILVSTLLSAAAVFSTPLASSGVKLTTRQYGWVECSAFLGYSNTYAIDTALNSLDGSPTMPFAVNPGACVPIWRDTDTQSWSCILVCNAVSPSFLKPNIA